MAERARALEREIAAEASADGRVRPQLAEWAVVGIALFYAVLLLFAPLAALTRGALSRGVATFFREVTTPDALSSLKLTFLLAVGATLGILGELFPGRRIVNGIVDMPFAVSPVIAGFMLIVLFGRTGWFAPAAEALGIKVPE